MKLFLAIGLLCIGSAVATTIELDRPDPDDIDLSKIKDDVKEAVSETTDDLLRTFNFKLPSRERDTHLLLLRPVGVVESLGKPDAIYQTSYGNVAYPRPQQSDTAGSLISTVAGIKALPIRLAVFKALLKTGQLNKRPTTTPKPYAPPSGSYKPNNYPANYKPPTYYPVDYKPPTAYPVDYKPPTVYPVDYKPVPTYPVDYKPPSVYPAEYKPSPSYGYSYPSATYGYPSAYPSAYPSYDPYHVSYGNRYESPKLVAIPIPSSGSTFNKGTLLSLLGSSGLGTSTPK